MSFLRKIIYIAYSWFRKLYRKFYVIKHPDAIHYSEKDRSDAAKAVMASYGVVPGLPRCLTWILMNGEYELLNEYWVNNDLAILVCNHENAIVAFRGNFEYSPRDRRVLVSYQGLEVNKEYYKAVLGFMHHRSFMADIYDLMNDGLRLTIAGHGRGGGLASILAILISKNISKINLFTFGEPKTLSERSVVDTPKNINKFRFIHENDFFPSHFHYEWCYRYRHWGKAFHNHKLTFVDYPEAGAENRSYLDHDMSHYL